MPIERLKPENFFDEERLKALKEVVPEAFADGKINWTTLKNALGAELEDGEKTQEHFGLFWPGKHEARRLASQPSKGTLVPVKGEGFNEETTGNIFIEGENLEVLKILRKSYSGRVKMIYIDPPYNTGNDFVYDDDFTEPLTDYLKRTGQIDGEGRPLTTNKKADGRFHSKWLSMMYPRLRLARELLRDDGVIFVSIDDNEVHHLRLVMNEIFGEENFLGCISVVSNLKGRSDDKYFATAHNYLVGFSKMAFTSLGVPIPDEYWDDYPETGKDGRRYRLQGLRKRGSSARREDRPKMFYPIYVNPVTFEVSLEKSKEFCKEALPKLSDNTDGRWRWGKETAESRSVELVGRQVGSENRWDIFQIDFAENETGLKRIKPKTIWTGSEFANEAGTLETKAVLGKKVFETPKPTGLLRYIFEQSLDKTEIIMDFFSGSATAAHALLDYNVENAAAHKFVLVQIPEDCAPDSEAFKAGYKTIAEIGKERIRRVIKKLAKENKEKAADLGFKVLKLTTSHYKQWENYHGESIEKLEELFDAHETPLIDQWRKVEDGLFTEILLLEGFPLDSSVNVKADFKKNAIREVTCDFHENRLVICLDDKIYADTIAGLKLAEGDTFICLDSAIDDQSKTRLSDKGLIKTI